jgi:hypothetical protein
MGIAQQIYAKTGVGNSEGATAGTTDLAAFQDVVAEFDALEVRGLISVTLRHRESHTGNRYVDVLRFTRLK